MLEAHIKVFDKEPRRHNFGILKELQENEVLHKSAEDVEQAKLEVNDSDQRLFFGDEFSDSSPRPEMTENENKSSVAKEVEDASGSENLIDYEKDFDEFMAASNLLLPSQLLMDDSLFNTSSINSNIDLLGSIIPQADQSQNNDSPSASKDNSVQLNKNPSKRGNDVSKWFDLFSDLDPLNQQIEHDLHAA